VGVPVHIVIHQEVGFLPRITEEPAKAFGNHNGDNPPVDELVNGKRNRGAFHTLHHHTVILIFFPAGIYCCPGVFMR